MFTLPDHDTAWGDECWRHSAGRRAIFFERSGRSWTSCSRYCPHCSANMVAGLVRRSASRGTTMMKFMRWLRGKQVGSARLPERSITEVEALARTPQPDCISFWMDWWSHYVAGRRCAQSSRTPGFARKCTVAALGCSRMPRVAGETTGGDRTEFGLPSSLQLGLRISWKGNGGLRPYASS